MSSRFILGTLAAAALLAGALPADALPRHQPVPGGVAVIPLGEDGETPPQVRFGDNTPVAVARQQGRWYALVGISLDSSPSQVHLNVTGPRGSRTLEFDIGHKNYPTQRLVVRDTRKVEPRAEDLARIVQEKELTGRIKAHYEDRPVEPDFVLPAKGRLSSRFGLRRFFNGQPRDPHAGLDVAVGTGAPIRAPAAGIVANVGDYFFNGNTVFIDHGQGLVSAYMHLSRVDVQAGQTVKRGDILGAAGATGRVTGPHLHWAVFLNGVAVDPELFLPRQ